MVVQWYPTTIDFPIENHHFGVFWGYHHLRKHPYLSHSPVVLSPVRVLDFSSTYSYRSCRFWPMEPPWIHLRKIWSLRRPRHWPSKAEVLQADSQGWLEFFRVLGDDEQLLFGVFDLDLDFLIGWSRMAIGEETVRLVSRWAASITAWLNRSQHSANHHQDA